MKLLTAYIRTSVKIDSTVEEGVRTTHDLLEGCKRVSFDRYRRIRASQTHLVNELHHFGILELVRNVLEHQRRAYVQPCSLVGCQHNAG